MGLVNSLGCCSPAPAPVAYEDGFEPLCGVTSTSRPPQKNLGFWLLDKYASM